MVAASWTTIHPEEAGLMAQTITVLGIDIATQVFHLVGMDDRGRLRSASSHCMLVRNSCNRYALVPGTAWAMVSPFLLGSSVSSPVV
jgi:hypothetical protein